MGQLQQSYLIGVDGGGTGCRVAVASADGAVIGTEEGGRANVSSDFDGALRNILTAMGQAADAAGLDQADVTQATIHLGLAGVVSDTVAANVARATGYAHVKVTDDRATALAGALGEADGYLIAVGTGTIIAASNDGNQRAIGAYGFHVSDQASAAWLGKRLLEQTLLCHDGLLSHSGLTKKTLAQFHDDPNAIATFSVTSQPADYGALAPAIVQAATSGDVIGTALMAEGYAYLRTGLNALGYTPDALLCLTGGVGDQYQPLFTADGITNIIKPRGSGSVGAVALAHKAAIARRGGAS